ncbi:hypothetical protein G6L37_01345 [Agrobacterium rubi]|nr:hypothetical protein [Agrobacterium rubi]NTF24037.1 hypothetical protein [Agrobacterium rubi]
MIIDHKELDLDERMNVAAILKYLADTRQAAYNAAKDMPILTPAYERAEEAYRIFTEEFGIDPRPVFDRDEYSAQRQAAGDALYENWKPKPPSC